MHARSRIAPLIAVCGLVAVFLAIPSSALANHVNAASSSATCAVVGGTPTITFKVVFESFSSGNKPVTGTISLDGTVVKTYSGATAITFPGSDFTLTYTQATTPGDHVIKGVFTWPGKTSSDNGKAEKEVTCPVPPTIGITVDKVAVESTAVAGSTVHFTVAVKNTGNTPFVEYTFSDPKCPGATRTGANAGDTTFDPGDVWNYACAMATQAGQTVADNTATATGKNAQGMTATAQDSASIPLTQPAVTPPPGGAVLPEETLSGQARMLGPSGCVKQAFRARVTGRSIASVAFFVDGRLVKRITGAHDVYSVRVRPRSLGLGRHRVVARVRFVAASGTAPQRFRLTFRRCAQQQVAPRFTG